MIRFASEDAVDVGQWRQRIRVGRWNVDCIFQVSSGGNKPSSGSALRLAEKLVADAIGLEASRVRVASLAPSGRPVVAVGGDISGLMVSVSHARDLYGAAASFNAPVGIDIVDPSDVTSSLQMFFTVEECGMMSGASRFEYGCLWAAKEAAFKATALDIDFQPLRVRIQQRCRQTGRFRWSLASSCRNASGVGRLAMVGCHIVGVAVRDSLLERSERRKNNEFANKVSVCS